MIFASAIEEHRAPVDRKLEPIAVDEELDCEVERDRDDERRDPACRRECIPAHLQPDTRPVQRCFQEDAKQRHEKKPERRRHGIGGDGGK